jgi:RND superfamily putative drug exporter
VLLDTIVVRSVLVTALNLDIGRYMWWPSALSRKQDVPLAEVADATGAVDHDVSTDRSGSFRR